MPDVNDLFENFAAAQSVASVVDFLAEFNDEEKTEFFELATREGKTATRIFIEEELESLPK